MTKKEFIRRSLAAKTEPTETMFTVMALTNFRDEYYFQPDLSWPQKEFDDRCTAIWAIDECIDRIRRQYQTPPTKVAEELLFELLRYMRETNNLEKEHIFRVASVAVEDILDYLNALCVL